MTAVTMTPARTGGHRTGSRAARRPEHVVLVAEPGAAATGAARWLARRSGDRPLELKVLLTASGAARGGPDTGDDRVAERMRASFAGSAAVRIGGRVVPGDECAAAVACSSGPDLVVIGTARVDEVCGRLHRVLAAAGDPPHCPIVVVPSGWQRTSGRVMAVFQGDGDDAVLAFAADASRADDTALALIRAEPAPEVRGPARDRGAGLRRLSDLLSRRSGPVDLDEVRDGTVVRTVLRAGTGAVLLVVSTHRLDALHGLLTGPISPAVIERPPCPIAIVHPRYRPSAVRSSPAAVAGPR